MAIISLSANSLFAGAMVFRYRDLTESSQFSTSQVGNEWTCDLLDFLDARRSDASVARDNWRRDGILCVVALASFYNG